MSYDEHHINDSEQIVRRVIDIIATATDPAELLSYLVLAPDDVQVRRQRHLRR